MILWIFVCGFLLGLLVAFTSAAISIGKIRQEYVAAGHLIHDGVAYRVIPTAEE